MGLGVAWLGPQLRAWDVDVTTSGGGDDAGAGSAEDLLYEIGSGSFLPGMDEPLRGAAAGHIAQFTTTLPDISTYLDGLVISEVMSHPTDPTAAEFAAGLTHCRQPR